MTARVSAASDLPRAPPTEPRSMRRDITPPTSKRPTASRQHDVYRPSPYASGEDFGRGGRLSISDVWRPGPNHYAGVASPEQASAGSPEHVRGDRARRVWRESPPRQTFDRVQEPSPPPPVRGGFEREEAGSKSQEQERLTAEVTTAVFWRILEAQHAARLSNNMGQSRVPSTFAPRLTDDDFDMTSSSVDPALRSLGTEDRHSLATCNVDGVADEQRVPLKAVALSLQDPKLFLTDSALSSSLQFDKTMNSPNKNMVAGALKRAKIPTEDTASNSSTTDSKTKTICRECRTPGSSLTPLVRCIRCERGYHHSCGNPKPPKGADAEEFVCGKCLKNQGRGPTSGDVSRSASITERPTVASASLRNTILPSTDDLKPPSRPPTHDQDHPAPQTKLESSQGTLYKSITCPWWRKGRCNLFEDHCLFAHSDTGHYAPNGRNPARAFTCAEWREGRCQKSSLDCLYSHRDTGLHVTFEHHVVRKHITCYYWKVNGTCTNYEKDCVYAHRDTGILAWKPAKDSRSPFRTNSLKNYICPRFETRGSCHLSQNECPYTHSSSAISCLLLTTGNRFNARQSDVSPVLDSRVPQALVSSSTSIPRMMSSSSVDRLSKPTDVQKIDQTNQDPSTIQMPSPILTTAVADIPSHDSKITDTISLPIGHHPRAGRQMAKRGGRISQPRKERINSLENAVPGTSAQNQSDTNSLDSVERISNVSTVTDIKTSVRKAQKETNPSSRLVGDTTLRSITDNRVKKCSQCGKMILGLATQCRACSTIDGKAVQDYGSRAPGSVSDDSDVEITGRTTAAAMNSDKKSGREIESEESSRRLVANILKRTNRDDHLFISVKKHKPSYAADMLAEAESRLRSAALTNIPSTQSGLHTIFGNSPHQIPPLVPVVEHVAASTSRASSSLHSSRDSSMDDYRHIHQTQALNQSAELATGASLSRLEEIVKDVTSQVKQRDAQKRMFQKMPPPALGSPILGTRDEIQDPEIMNESFEPDIQPVQLTKQNHLAQHGHDPIVKNTVEDQVAGLFGRAKSPSHSAVILVQAHQAETSGKAQITSETLSSSCESCRNAHKKCVHKSGDQIPFPPSKIQPAASSAPRGISDQAHQLGIVEKAKERIGTKATSESLSYRCKPCINAHKKCLHAKGGALDVEKCILFLEVNPTRPQTGKVSIDMWQKINEAVRLVSKDSTEANVAVSETESSDLSMGLDAQPLAAQIPPVERPPPKLRLIVKVPSRNALQKESSSKNPLNLIETPVTTSDHIAAEGPARALPGDRRVPQLQTRAVATLGENMRQTADDSDDDLPLAFTRSRPQDDSSVEDLPLAVTRSGDRVERYYPMLPPPSSSSDDDLPLAVTRSGDRMERYNRLPPQPPSTSISNTLSLEAPDVRNNINVLKRPRDQSKDSAPTLPLPISGSVSTLSPSVDPGPDVVVPGAVAGKINKALPRRRQPQPQPQPTKTQPLWTDEDEQRAVDALRARGVVIESESEDDGEASDYYDELSSRAVPPLITDPLHHMPVSRNPFDVDHSLDLRSLENRYKALDIRPPWKRNRPTKKELMSGNALLLYQTRENRLKYGDPHIQLIRKVGDEVPVTALVEIDKGFNIDSSFDTPGSRELSVQRVSTTFREFMGMPKAAVIAQGKNKDELVFLEKKLEGGDGTVSGGRVRARRVRDDEVFPFIYN
ncbi:hypothetical protein LTR84_000520 [Exophiala bonariae]|uniref:C3H1-type domain-containing protein n=1 Tax=Exophiala bonariae TaxID=1690606 RepID=A0AAV9NQT0_9EURO|nr:hypothetical protein LTR84_000520 [Exophiala bonariae]